MENKKNLPEESAADFIARMNKEAAHWRAEGERWRAESLRWRAEGDKWRIEGEHYLAEAKRIMAESAADTAETKAILKSIAKEHGDFTRSEGLIFEEEVVLAVTEARGIGDIKLDTFTEDLRSWAGNQYDLVGINGKCAVIVEAKRSLRLADITDLADKSIPALKADFAPNLKGKSVKGAIVYRRIYGKPAKRRDIARAALTRGIILVRATGKNKLHHITNEAEVTIPARALKNPAKGDRGKANNG